MIPERSVRLSQVAHEARGREAAGSGARRMIVHVQLVGQRANLLKYKAIGGISMVFFLAGIFGFPDVFH